MVTPEAIALAAEASPLREGSAHSRFADPEELVYREQIEPIGDPVDLVVRHIERKELPRKLAWDFARAGLHPHGTVIDFGAGTCWLSATLARRPEVDRIIAIEFSRRRLVELAPIAIAHLEAPAEKIERVVADFYAHGLEDEIANMVVLDAAFHHASDPVRLARVAHGLLRPGGQLVLFREPAKSLLRRRRDHRLEGEHGSFEHEYDPRVYLRFLREAGFEARKYPGAYGFKSPLRRARVKPPLSWLNGIVTSMYTYVGTKPLR